MTEIAGRTWELTGAGKKSSRPGRLRWRRTVRVRLHDFAEALAREGQGLSRPALAVDGNWRQLDGARVQGIDLRIRSGYAGLPAGVVPLFEPYLRKTARI